MADVFLFVQHGWKSIWTQKAIWPFSAVMFLGQLYDVVQGKRPTDLLSALISLTASLFFIFLFYVGYIGVLYLAYSFLIGRPVNVQETLSAVKKFSGRVIGCSCLGLLTLLPLLFWVVVISINSSTHRLEISNKTILALMPLSIFAALFQFTMIGFFANDWSIRQSLDKAWSIFKNHFGVLAVLGLILAIISRLYTMTSGIFTVLIQSGFNITAVNQLVLLNPSASLSKNLLFVLINGIGDIILFPISASIFISAYLKYSGAKLPFPMRIK